MKKEAEEQAAAPAWKSLTAKAEKPEKQPGSEKAEKPKAEQPKRERPRKQMDKGLKSKAPHRKRKRRSKRTGKTAPTVQAAPVENPKTGDAPRRGKEQIVYIKLNELTPSRTILEVRDDEEMRAMVSSVKDKA